MRVLQEGTPLRGVFVWVGGQAGRWVDGKGCCCQANELPLQPHRAICRIQGAYNNLNRSCQHIKPVKHLGKRS